MGLDITVYRLTKKKCDDYYTFHKSDDDEITSSKKAFIEHGFKDYFRKKTQEYFNFEKYFKEHNMNMEDYDFVSCGIISGEQKFTFQKKNEELENVWEHVQQKYREMFPDDEEFLSVNKLFDDKSIDFLTDEDKEVLKKNKFKGEIYRENPRSVRGEIDTMKYDLWPLYEFCHYSGRFQISGKDVPTEKSVDEVIYKEEIGYQRKGLNGNFYSDYREGKIGYFVFTKAELERYKEEYCDEDHDVTNTDVDGNERFLYHATPKDDFQHNIIDNFVEGECVVSFDW